MRSLMQQLTAARCFVQPPGPGETVSSVLARAAADYALDPLQLLSDLQPRNLTRIDDLDRPTEEGAASLDAAFGFRPGTIAEHALSPDQDLVLEPKHRIAYCPRCAQEDYEQCGHPRFRRAWANTLCLHCDCHGLPLMPWPIVDGQGRRSIPARGSLEERHLGAVLSQHLATAERTLTCTETRDGCAAVESLIATLKTDSKTARRVSRLVEAVGGNRRAYREYPFLASIAPRMPMRAIFESGGKLDPECGVGERIGFLCKMGDPALRRSLLLTVSQRLERIRAIVAKVHLQ